MGRLAILLVLFASCDMGAVDEDNFIDRAAKEGCQQIKRCARGMFDAEYSDMDDCIDENIDWYEDAADDYDEWGCDFDDDAAQECVDFLKSADCEEFWEDYLWGEGDDCAEVWDCT